MSNTIARMVDRLKGKRKPDRAAIVRACAGILPFEALESRVLLSDSVQVNAGQILNSVTDNFLGVNYVAFWDSNQGDAGSAQALKNAGVQVLRFPGGEPANWYNYADPTYDAWSSTTPASLVAYAQSVGAQLLMLQTDPTTNGDNNPSAASAAGWVSEMKSLGDQAPYWEIGNENDGAGNNGATAVTSNYDWTNYQSYINTFNAQATAMHAADPSIQIYGNAGTNDYYWWQLHSLDMFLNKTGNRFGSGEVDGVSVHYYPTVPTNATFAQIEANAETIPSRIAAITQMTAAQDTRNLPIIISETSAANGSSAGPIDNEMGAALANADLIAQYKADGVQQVDWFGSIHYVNGSWGILYGGGSDGTLDQASPQYWILPILSHMGNIELGESGVTNASTGLSAYATLNSNGNVEELLINKNATADTVSVGFNGFNPTGDKVNIYSLSGATDSATDTSIVYNGVANPNDTSAAGLPPPTTATATSSTYQTVVPAYSIQMLDFQVNSAKLLPVTRISSPGNTDLIDAGSTINLGADAISSSGDGIAKVQFYANGTLVGTSTSETYNNFTTSWSNVAAGTYTIDSVATDNNGATSSSAPITITVQQRVAYSTVPVVPISGQVIIQAENFDQGGEGWGYHSLDEVTSTYRPTDDIQLQASGDTGGGWDVTNTQNSEWLAYSINVTTSGTYSLSARVNDPNIGGYFNFNIDGANVGSQVAVPYTGTAYTNVGINNVYLTAGTHVLRLVMDAMNPTTNGLVGNFNYLTVSGTPITVAAPNAPTLAGSAGDTHASLSWNLAPGVASFNLYRGTSPGAETLYQSDLITDSYTDSNVTNGTAYYYTVVAVNQGGNSLSSNEVMITPKVTLPAPWVSADIGSPGLSGFADYANGTYTLNGSGSDIWNDSDQFQFVYQPVVGDVTIIAHVDSVGDTAAWAKAGIMIRQSLAADSVNANLNLNPSGWAMLDWRTSADGGTSNTNTATDGIYAPDWIKLVRSGNTFTGYYSTDGVNWTQVGTTSATITMTGTVYVGLSDTSTSNTALSTDVFDSVSVSGTVAAPAAPALNTPVAGDTQVGLTWNAVAGATSYNLYRGTASGTETEVKTGITTAYYTDNNLTDGQPYYYEVTAVNSGNESGKSNEQTVTPIAIPPVAKNDSYSTNEDTTLTVAVNGVLANDTGANGRTFTASLVSGTAHGTLTFDANGDGGFTYIPKAGFAGSDSFTYKDTDSDGEIGNVATVTLSVTAVAPTAANDSYGVNESATLTIAPSGVLANDSAPAGETLTASLVSGPADGTLTLDANGDGGFTYVPNSGYTGGDSFIYKATDTNGLSAEATVTLNVASVTGLPAPWQAVSVGAVGVPGSATYSNGTFTVNGSGADIYGSADAFEGVFQTLTDNGQIIAQILTVPNTGSYAKTGVMIRATTAANSQQASMILTPSGAFFENRATTGGGTGYNQTSASAPLWVKLVRSGNLFSGYISSNGTSWSLVGSTTIAMGSSVQMGLVTCSWNNKVVGTGTFDNVSVSTGVALPASQLAFAQQPGNATVGLALAPPVTVDVEDSGGNLVSTDNSNVTLSVNSGPGTLSGTVVAQASGGIATFSNLTLSSAGTYTLSAADSTYTPATSSSFTVSAATTGLPAPWQAVSVGAVGVAGSATYSNGTFTVNGSGADIYGSADAFEGVFQSLNGDGTIIAQITGVPTTGSYAKAGVMIRASTAANSQQAAMILTPNGAFFESRTSTGGGTGYNEVSASAPLWVKLVRSGNTFTGYISSNGTSWSLVGSTTIVMGASVEMGLVTCSWDNKILGTGTFDNVSVLSSAPLPATQLAFAQQPTNTTVGNAISPPVTVEVEDAGGNLVDTDNSDVTISIASGPGTLGGTVVAQANDGIATFSNLSLSAGGTYTLAASDSTYTLATSASFTVSTGLPAPWAAASIGSVGIPGSATYNNGTFTVNGSGADIYGTVDAFEGVFQTLNGDGTIVAQVLGVPGTGAYAKAGVMIRASTAANSQQAAMILTPSGAFFESRTTTGGSTGYNQTSAAPYWVMLVRSGNTIAGYISPDGVNWKLVGTTTIAMGTSVQIGLVTTSWDNSLLGTGVFDNVSVT